MNTVDIIAEILKREGIEVLSCFPTTPIIESAAKAGIRPIICRQERVGVGIADGYSRITNGDPLGVFAMQYVQELRMRIRVLLRHIPILPRCYFFPWGIQLIGNEYILCITLWIVSQQLTNKLNR